MLVSHHAVALTIGLFETAPISNHYQAPLFIDQSGFVQRPQNENDRWAVYAKHCGHRVVDVPQITSKRLRPPRMCQLSTVDACGKIPRVREVFRGVDAQFMEGWTKAIGARTASQRFTAVTGRCWYSPL